MLARLAYAAVLVVAVTVLFSPRCRLRLLSGRSISHFEWLFVATRLSAWFASYVVWEESIRFTDLALYYYPEGLLAASGAVPYAEFQTSYGPLFPYVAAAGIAAWSRQAGVALVMVTFEIAAVLTFSRGVRGSLSPGERDQLAASIAAYTLNPAALYWSGITAYNSSVVLFFWVLTVLALRTGRRGWAALAAGGSVLLGKLLGVLILPVWMATCRRHALTVVTAGGTALASWLILRQTGIDLLLPLYVEGSRVTAGNLWFMLGTATTDVVRTQVPLVILGSSMAGMATLFLMRWQEPPSVTQLCAAASACGWLFMLISQKAYPHYTSMFVLFTIFAMVSSRKARSLMILVALVGAAGVLEPGLWNAIGQPTNLRVAWTRDVASQVALLAAVDAILIAIGAYLFMTSVWLAVHAPVPASSPTSQSTPAT